MKKNKRWFYGIYGIEFIYHGDWADPEIIWHKHSFNYYDLETPLYYDFKEENPDGNEDDFAIWVKDNAHLAREYLQTFLECKRFYGQ